MEYEDITNNAEPDDGGRQPRKYGRWLATLGFAAVVAGLARAEAARLRRRHDPERGEVLSEPLGEKGHYVESFDSTRIYSEELGRGPALVLVHGWFCNTDMWHYQKKLMADSFRIICFDQRGHRRSECPDRRAYTLRDLAMDLKAVLDEEAGLEPVVLVGHSMGGMSILKFLQMFPDELGGRVKGVALVDTSNVPMHETIAGGSFFRPLQKPLVEPLFSWVTDHPDFFDAVKDVVVKTSPFLLATRYLGYGSGASLTHMEYIQEMASKTSMRGACLAGLGLLGSDEDFSLEAIRDSRVPVLIWVGEKDKLTRPEVSIRMKEQLPDADLRLVPDTGHPSYMEEYRQFNQALAELADKSFVGIRS
jgi:pimeloyl-ACP methyl ester carboxylesterase